MKHRHLRDGEGLGPAVIDDILDRGGPADWAALWHDVDTDPYGPMATDVVRICGAHRMFGTSWVWPAMIEQARADARARGRARLHCAEAVETRSLPQRNTGESVVRELAR